MNWFNVKIFIQTLFQSFSFDRESPRFASLKRVLIVLLFVPVFVFFLTFNWLFLLLDEILFPSYRKQQIPKIVFIIGIPRSATTYLLQLIHKDKEQFTSPKLWEMLFAPAISQKLFYLASGKIFKFFGNPFAKLYSVIDKFLFRNTSKVHEMGLNKVEEDEYYFLYNLSSLFYYFFFPGVKNLLDFVYHDMTLPANVIKHNMNFYQRMVQRHNYVFNKTGERYYLSKNPTFIPRMQSVMNKFPQAKLVYPLRNPFQTIPSTISLFTNNYVKFCTLSEKYPMADFTRDVLLNWYVFAHETLERLDKSRYKILMYDQIIKEKKNMVMEVCEFLDIDSTFILQEIDKENNQKKKFKSQHKYDRDVGVDEKIIFERLKNVMPDEVLIRL